MGVILPLFRRGVTAVRSSPSTGSNDGPAIIPLTGVAGGEWPPMSVTCANCGEADLPVRRYHVYLATDEVVEVDLCEGCRHKFVTAPWVEAVV